MDSHCHNVTHLLDIAPVFSKIGDSFNILNVQKSNIKKDWTFGSELFHS